MKVLFVLLCFLLLPALSFAETVNFEWQANTESDLAGYEIHWGIVEGVYSNVIDVPLAGLPTPPKFSIVDPGVLCGNDETRFFALLAYDVAGNKSGLSGVVQKTFNPPPCSPEIFKKLVKDAVMELMQNAKIETTIRFPRLIE